MEPRIQNLENEVSLLKERNLRVEADLSLSFIKKWWIKNHKL
jgi:hypothetical protein